MKTTYRLLAIAVLVAISAQQASAQMMDLQWMIQQNQAAQYNTGVQLQQLHAQQLQNTEMATRKAIQAYRQQTGDYSTSDQQVVEIIWAKYGPRQTPNDNFSRNLRAREDAFYQQQAKYAADRNVAMDASLAQWKDQSAQNSAGHRRFITEGIYEQGNYRNHQGEIFQMPNYQPGSVWSGGPGNTMIQDSYGQYHHFDGNGARTDMFYVPF